MRRRTRVEIAVETRLLVVRRCEGETRLWCPECSAPVRSLRPEEAALLAGVDTRAVYRWVEAGWLHGIETAEPSPRICLDSLLGLAAALERDGAGGCPSDADQRD